MAAPPDHGSARCSMCGICYPPRFVRCRVCQEPTNWFSNVEPDEDWEETVALYLRDKAPPESIPEVLEPPEPIHVYRISGFTPVLRRGQYFLTDRAVEGAGLPHLEPLALVQIGRQTFEVMGYHEMTGEYWIRPFSLEPTDEDMEWLGRRRA